MYKIFIDPSIESVSQAYKSGLRTGDRITSINGNNTENFEELFTEIALSKGDPIQVTYLRDGQQNSVSIVPSMYSSGGRPAIGVEPAGERRVVATFTYGEQISEWLNQKLESQKCLKEIVRVFCTKYQCSQIKSRRVNKLFFVIENTIDHNKYQ